MKKLFLLAAFLLLAAVRPASAGTWTLVHSYNPGAVSCTPSCNITVTSTGSGNLLVAGFSASATSVSGITISSVSGGGTWTLCATSGCHTSDSTNLGADMAYCLSSSSGATTITLTLSGSIAARLFAAEYSTTAGPAILDTNAIRDQTSNTTAPVGVALTIGGANDVIIQVISGNTVSAISGSYTNPDIFSSNMGMGGLINSNSGTAPTWTQSNGHAALTAIAFKETTAAAGVVPRHH